jgi:Zn-dependent protease with chaperone function
MVAAFRAAVAAVMLAGFYVLALVMFLATILLGVWLAAVTNAAIAVKLVAPLIVASLGAVAVALWRTLRAKPEEPHGLPLTPQQAPYLWQMVHELAGVVRTRMPDEIRIVPDVNAAVVENSRLLGLIGGRRLLYVGLPLLQVFTLDQLRSVIAHELGHYSGRHTRFGAIAYRGRMAIGGTIGRIGPYNVVGWVFKAYAWLYLLADSAVVRRQELEADQASVLVAGRDAAAGALREVPVLSAAWDFYLSTYLEAGWDLGYAPDDLFGGFRALVDARKAELDEMRSTPPSRDASVWDTHPPIVDRIAAIARTPEPPTYRDGRPAALLLPDIAGIGRQLQQATVLVGERTILPWPQFTAASMTARMQRQADTIFRNIARTIHAPGVSLPMVLDLIAAGRAGEIAEPLFPDNTRREAAGLFAGPLEVLFELAAIRSGVAGFLHSWSGPATLVGMRDGEPVQLRPLAELALQPNGQYEARRRLANMGINVQTVGQVEQRADAVGANAIAALANVKVAIGRVAEAGGEITVEHDVLVLDKGLILVANPGDSDHGRRRLEHLLAVSQVHELAARNWFLPYEEVASASVSKRVPLRAELVLHDGRRVAVHETWSGEQLTKDSRDVLLSVLDSLRVR